VTIEHHQSPNNSLLKVIEAMTAMSRISEAHANCIVIVEHEQVVGLLTERDVLRLAIQ